MHSSWYNVLFKGKKYELIILICMQSSSRLLNYFSPDKTLYSEISLTSIIFYLHAMLSFYICAIILIKVLYPNTTFIIIYSNKMHTIIMIKKFRDGTCKEDG